MPKKKRGKWEKRLYAILVAFAVIAFWRGAWGLMDEYLFPANYELSLWVSLVFGLIILLFTHSILNELI